MQDVIGWDHVSHSSTESFMCRFKKLYIFVGIICMDVCVLVLWQSVTIMIYPKRHLVRARCLAHLDIHSLFYQWNEHPISLYSIISLWNTYCRLSHHVSLSHLGWFRLSYQILQHHIEIYYSSRTWSFRGHHLSSNGVMNTD